MIKQIDIDEIIHDLSSSTWNVKIRALSKAITFIENSDEALSRDLIKKFQEAQFHPAVTPRDEIHDARDEKKIPHVVGLTGFPGAGKSTLVNLLVKELRAQKKTVAVIAIDPSSSISGGAVLGDRIRMQDHFKDDGVFIRSMGARGALGGLAHATLGALELVKLLNFDFILIETVGIGQSESSIVQLADTVLLVLLPNTGDEVQFMKAGVIQLAHIYVINKCDLSDPHRMIQELEDNTPHANGWQPPVVSTSALENRGISDLISCIEKHQMFLQKNKNTNQSVKSEKVF